MNNLMKKLTDDDKPGFMTPNHPIKKPIMNSPINHLYYIQENKFK